MISTLIIEDEAPAAHRLQRLLLRIEPQLHVLAVLDSVEAAVAWLQSHPAPELMLLDVHLTDGDSFQIATRVQIDSFVIFTTAYDEYALQAFRLNSVDYLLKPIDEAHLQKAVQKSMRLRQQSSPPSLDQLLGYLQLPKPAYKTHFWVNAGTTLRHVEQSQVLFFYGEAKTTFLCCHNQREWPVDFSLDKLEGLLDPQLFHRISRRYLLNFACIAGLEYQANNRVLVQTLPATTHELLVSTARLARFRQWLDR